MRPMPNFSPSQAMVGSISEMVEVSAASASMMKNRPPTSAPSGIWPKAIGRVTKISPGPEPGSRPLANTSGKIARPASRATAVSASATISEVRTIEVPAGR
ncbi:hypothetical protein D3C81_2024160 [compost metagenome]